MTTETEYSQEEQLYALEEIARSVAADAVDFRADVPAGTPLGESQDEFGGVYRWKKADSKQRMGSMALPERVNLYNMETGDISRVPPTIAQKRIMQRPQVYTMRRPADFPVREPIDDTCDICLENRGGVPRPFYSLYDLEAHYQICHPREWATKVRQEELTARKNSDDRMTTLISLLLQNQGIELPDEIKDGIQAVARPRGRRKAE